MTKQQVKTAERKAMDVFDKWNDLTSQAKINLSERLSKECDMIDQRANESLSQGDIDSYKALKGLSKETRTDIRLLEKQIIEQTDFKVCHGKYEKQR